MPLLKRKIFKRNPIPEDLRDSDEVFYCEQTKEIFKNYDEFFERVMLTNSVIWVCSLTGRPNLTFAEALASERTARKLLRQFPSALRGPIILVASQTKRSVLSELIDDVFNFVKDRYFKDEKLDVMNSNSRGYRFCKIIEVIKPENYDPTKVYEPSQIEYRVEAVDDNIEPKSWTVKGESIRRDKTLFSKEKTKLFLKQNVEGVNAMLKVKNESLKKYADDRGLKMDQFIGKLPDFGLSKKLQLQQEKSKNGTSISKKKKQGDIAKYLNSSKEMTKEEKKQRDENSKKFRDEMEAKRKAKADCEAEKQKKVAEEKARLLAKTQATVREHNQTRDDLELTDQRVIPKGKRISALIDQKYFADFVKILEFLHSFPEVLSISDKFPFGITMEVLERSLISKEVNGPLSDIIQVFLSTLFSLQVEEENEIEIEYRINGDAPLKHSKLEQMKNATRVHTWVHRHYSTKINELVMDSTTVTELLRLHLMSSGAIVSDKASKYRFAQRGGYKSTDDPGFHLVTRYPHITKFMSQYSVFQLSTKDIIRVLTCLMDQILTYSNIREVIEDRLELSVKAKNEYKNLKATEKSRERKVNEEKKQLQEEHKNIIAKYADEKPPTKDALIKKAEIELEQKIAKIDAQSHKEHLQYLKDLKAQVSIFFNHQTYLGMDRAYRCYYIFESMPGLFVVHDITYSGKCLDNFVKNNPALAHCTREQRYGIIKQMVANEEAGGNDDKENKADVNGTESDKATLNGKRELDAVTQRDLFMCNCDPATCVVHSENGDNRIVWSYYNTAEEIDALIESLNVRGYREKMLRDQLESSRDIIIDYIKDCPTHKLQVLMNEDEKLDELKKIARRMVKKYDNANLNCDAGTDANVIYDLALREVLLDFEQKLNIGCLGEINVSDRLVWRRYIEDLEYCSMDGQLTWGNARSMNGILSNGHAKGNGAVDIIEIDDEYEETASSVEDIDAAQTFDSGNCSDMETDYTTNELKTTEMEVVKLKVKNLAMALLQIEQGIDVKFIRAPFGPSKELKDKDAMTRAFDSCKKRILQWEESLMKSTSYSQVFLHYNILHDSIQWSRSAQKISCMICRRKNDPEQTLLCDECNKAWHMFCLKPKLTEIPQGDWFCPKCRPDDYKVKPNRKRKIFVEEESESDAEQESTVEEETADSNASDPEEICAVCNYEGELCFCKSCSMQCHPECAKPPLKKTRVKNWQCWKCTAAIERSERIKRRRMDKGGNDESQSEGSENESEEPQPKARKVEKPTGRRSKRTYEETEQSEEQSDEDKVPAKKQDDGSRRSSRRVSRPSRMNSPEPEERSSRRSSRKFAEESPAERRASKRSLDALNTISLSALIDEIIKNKNAWPFIRPVSVSEVPDYLDVIKNPMDFSKIKSKLNLGEYKTNEQMMKDIELVFFNCDLYNVSSTEIYKEATKLERFVMKRCKELGLAFKPSEMISS